MKRFMQVRILLGARRLLAISLALLAAVVHAGPLSGGLVDATEAPNHAAWVDLRPSASYAVAHIPGSLSVRPFEAKALHFLRDRPVVLVNDAYAGRATRAVQEDLLRAGFSSVHALRGGIQAWVESGRTIEGTGDADRLWRVEAVRLHGAAAEDDWIGVAAESDLSAIPGPHATLHAISCEASLDPLAAARRDDPRPIVILSEPDCAVAGGPPVRQVLAERLGRRPFVLDDGWDAYARQAAIQARWLARAVHGERSSRRTLPAASGCATCPPP